MQSSEISFPKFSQAGVQIVCADFTLMLRKYSLGYKAEVYGRN